MTTTVQVNLQPVLKKNQYEVMTFIRNNQTPIEGKTNGWVFKGSIDSTPVTIYSRVDRKTWGDIYEVIVNDQVKTYKTGMGLVKFLRKI